MCRLMHSLKKYLNQSGCHDDCGDKIFHDYCGYPNDHFDNHDNLTASLPNVQTDAFHEKYLNYPGCHDDCDYRGYHNIIKS